MLNNLEKDKQKEEDKVNDELLLISHGQNNEIVKFTIKIGTDYNDLSEGIRDAKDKNLTTLHFKRNQSSKDPSSEFFTFFFESQLFVRDVETLIIDGLTPTSREEFLKFFRQIYYSEVVHFQINNWNIARFLTGDIVDGYGKCKKLNENKAEEKLTLALTSKFEEKWAIFDDL